jgi:formamidopyrimidine-DNA glycosylase
VPELPEVEIVMRRLRDGAGSAPSIVGRTVERVRVPSTRIVVAPSRTLFMQRLSGAKITGARRRAKHILVDTSEGTLALHLRMTGDLHVQRVDEPLPKFTRLALELDDDWTLAFTDGRHLGTARLLSTPEEVEELLRELGPEPLEPAWTLDAFAQRLRGARAVKAALLDQTVVAGVGNIYADESLFRARIKPTRKVTSLSRAEVRALHAAIRAALTDSIQSLVDAGATIAWRYQNRDSESPFLVYDRGGEPCTRCGAKLSTTRVAGRTTVMCKRCQH